MKKVFIVIFLVFCFSGFSQSTNQLSWYKMLTGKIDHYAITMHLHKTAHQFFGYYYYNSQQQPIYFIGEDTTQQGRIKLTPYANPEGMEEFNFLLSDNSANGTWKADGKKESRSFTAAKSSASVSFTYIFTSGGVSLRANLKDSPGAVYEASSVWPEGNTATDTFLKTVIRQLFSKHETGNEEIGSLLLKEKKAYFSDYLWENKNVKKADLKGSMPFYSWSVSNRLMIVYQSSKLLTLAFSNYSYTGGAHGNFGTTYVSIDMIHAKKLKLSDVVDIQGQKVLGSLLAKYFRVTYNLSATDSLQKGGLFDNSIKPNDNFYITSKGIGFDYTPYEIGPYAMGEIDIFIPAKDLDKYVQPAFKSFTE